MSASIELTKPDTITTHRAILDFVGDVLRPVKQNPIDSPEVVGKDLRLITLWASKGGGKSTILDRIAQGLSGEDGVVVSGPWQFAGVGHDWKNYLDQIQLWFDTSPAGQRKVLLLDNLDHLLHIDEGKDFFEFEKKLIHPLIEREDTLIIATGQVELKKWTIYEVRKRHVSIHIPVLTPAEVAEFARGLDIEPDRMFNLSLGYPQVIRWLNDNPRADETVVAGRVQDYFLGDLDPPIRNLARVACLLPVFSVPILRSILPGKAGEAEGEYDKYIHWLRELAGKGLITWDVRVGAYRFCDGILRLLLARSLYYTDTEAYLRVREKAVEYFDAEVQYAAYLQNTLPSAVYHRARLLRTEKREPVGENCRVWVQDHLRSWAGADWSAVAEAWRTGAGDPVLVRELQRLLNDEFQQIAGILESHKDFE